MLLSFQQTNNNILDEKKLLNYIVGCISYEHLAYNTVVFFKFSTIFSTHVEKPQKVMEAL